MNAGSRRLRLVLGGVLLVGAVSVVFTMHPYPEWPAQDPSYHRFADARPWLGIPNAWNVLSNLPFVVIGFLGLLRCLRATAGWERTAFAMCFAGVALTGFGSAYYHWDPTSATLYWDRLPMTLVFMPLVSIVLGDRMGGPWGRRTVWPLAAVGVAAITYWHFTEQAGHGDIRPYVMVQFGSLLLFPYVLLAFPPRRTATTLYLGVLGWYLLAKLLEVSDLYVYDTCTVSGHTGKHLAAALATLWIYRLSRPRLS